MYNGLGSDCRLETVSTQAVMELMKNVTVPETDQSVRLSNDEVERYNIAANVAEGELNFD